MSAYSMLALGFIAVGSVLGILGAIVLRAQGWSLPLRSLTLTALIMLGLTVIFDNLMIAVDLYRYPAENLSGITIGLVPLEDLSYPLAVCLSLPVWFKVLLGLSCLSNRDGEKYE